MEVLFRQDDSYHIAPVVAAAVVLADTVEHVVFVDAAVVASADDESVEAAGTD